MISHPSLKRNTQQTNKQQLFRFFHKLLYQYKISPLLFTFFILMQTLQIMYFAIHPSCCMLWDLSGLKTVQNILGFISGSLVWVYGGIQVGLGFNVVFFVVGVVAVGVIGYQVRNGKPSQLTVTNNFHQIRIKFMQYYSALLRTILIIPLSSLFIYTIKSHQNNPTSLTTVSITFTSLSFLTCSILLYLFLELFIDNSPFSKFSLSGPLTLNQKYKTVLKFVIGVVSGFLSTTCVSSDDNIHLILLILMIGGFVYLSYLNYSQANLVNNLVRKVSEHCNITIISLFALVLIQKLITPKQKITLFWMAIVCILVNFGWVRAKRAKQDKLIYSVYKSLSTKEEILAYNYLMCQYIRDFYKDPLCLVKLQGIMTDHLLNCKKLDEVCRCRLLRKKIRNFGYESDRVQAQLQAPYWFEFLKSNLVFNTQKMNHLPEFYLFLSYIQKDILNNNFVSYANLQKCSNKNKNMNIQFLVYHQKRIIERNFLLQDQKSNQKKQVDVNKFIQMSDIVDKFHQKVLKSSIQHLDFWKALSSCKKNKEIIMKQGNRLLQTVKQCQQIYHLISEKYSHNLESIVLYSNYSKYILNNHQQILKNRTLFNLIKKKLCRSIKISSQQEKEKYSENSITASIIISGKKSNIGIIKACSSKVTKILKYAPYELIGQNINTTMPVFLGHLHNDVLINYLDQAQPQSNFVQRLAPMLDKNNFMILGRIMTKPVPSLINGLQIIGIFQKIKQNNIRHMNENPKYMLYRCDNGNIEALSQNFHTYYGYRLMRVNQFYEICEQLNFTNIFQGISSSDIKDCEEGHQCWLKVKKSLKKIVRVKVYVRMEFVYFGTKVRLLSIFTSAQGSFNTMMLNGGAMTINPSNQGAMSQKSSQHSGSQQNPLQPTKPNPTNQPKPHETLTQQQRKQLQNKIPIKFRVFQVLVVIFVISILAISSAQFYENILQIKTVWSYLEHGQYLSNSLVYLINIGYYARMMELSAAYPQVLVNFQQYKSNVSIYTDNLQISQFWLVNKQSQISDTINFNYNDTPLSWLIGQQNNIYSKQTSLNLQIFDLVTSSSQFFSSSPSDFNFQFVLTDDKDAQSNPYFRGLFRVRYSALFELIPAKLKYSSTLFSAYQAKIHQSFRLTYIEVGVAAALVIVFLVINLKILYLILRSIFSITTLFNWLTTSQIQKQIRRCETFLEHFFISNYEVVVRMKKQEILRGHSFQETQNQKCNQEKNMQCFMDEDVDKDNANEKTAEIDIVEIQQKDGKDKQSQSKLGQNNQETCPLKADEEEAEKQEDSNESIFLGNTNTFLPLILCFFLVLLYFIGIFFYSKNCDIKTLTELKNQNLIHLNIQTLDMLKYYGLQSIIDPSKFKSYPLLKNTFDGIAYNLYKYQQQLNTVVDKQGNNIDQFLFKLLQMENEDNVCAGNFYTNTIFSATSFNTNECRSIDSGVLSEGLRASIVAYIQNIKNTTKQSKLDKLVASSSFQKSLLLTKYIKNSFQRILRQHKNHVSEYMSTQLTISIVFFSLFLVYAILIGVFISFKIGNQLKMKILGTSQIISLIPERIFHRNVNLCAEYRKNVKQLLQ